MRNSVPIFMQLSLKAFCKVKKLFVFTIAERVEKINLLSEYRHKDHSVSIRKSQTASKKKRGRFHNQVTSML